jgi:hypothetical protein
LSLDHRVQNVRGLPNVDVGISRAGTLGIHGSPRGLSAILGHFAL